MGHCIRKFGPDTMTVGICSFLYIYFIYIYIYMQFYLSTFYLFLAVLGFPCCTGFSLVVESGGCSWLQGLLLWRTGSRVGRLSR